MFGKAIVLVSFLAARAAAQRVEMTLPPAMMARQTSSDVGALPTSAASSASSVQTINASKVSAQLNSFLSANPVSAEFTTVSETLGISVPSSLQIAIMTAVPASVIIDLMNPVAQSSMQSEFQAGNTPAWYTSMPADVQSWFEAFAREKATGSPVFTVTSTSTTAGTGASHETADGAAASSSSSSGLAARPTGGPGWAVVANAVAFAGVVGVGIAL